MSTLFATVFSFVLRLGFYVLAAAVAFGVLLLGVFALVGMLLRALFTGRKPMPWLIWQQYRSAARQAQGRWTRRAAPAGHPGSHYGSAPDDEVVDVQARELSTGHLPPPR